MRGISTPSLRGSRPRGQAERSRAGRGEPGRRTADVSAGRFARDGWHRDRVGFTRRCTGPEVGFTARRLARDSEVGFAESSQPRPAGGSLEAGRRASKWGSPRDPSRAGEVSWEPRARLVLQAPESSPWPAPDPSLGAGGEPSHLRLRGSQGSLKVGWVLGARLLSDDGWVVRVPDAEDSACWGLPLDQHLEGSDWRTAQMNAQGWITVIGNLMLAGPGPWRVKAELVDLALTCQNREYLFSRDLEPLLPDHDLTSRTRL